MSHVLFDIPYRETNSPLETADAERLRRREESLRSLGLDSQVQRTRAEIAVIERGSRIETPPLTAEELLIWGEWLPTVYTAKPSMRQRALADYDFDRVPQPVLDRWQHHKTSGLFDSFEIWTPERTATVDDPILIGVIGTSRYLLARWGESDANLVSIEDIKREIERRWYGDGGISTFTDHYVRRDTWDTVLIWSGILCVLIAATALIVGQVLDFEGPGALVLLAIPASVTSCIIGVMCLRRFVLRRAARRSKLMQAIALHDRQHVAV